MTQKLDSPLFFEDGDIFDGFGYDTKEKMLPLIFSIFAVMLIYNHGLPYNYDIDKMINTVFIYLFTY